MPRIPEFALGWVDERGCAPHSLTEFQRAAGHKVVLVRCFLICRRFSSRHIASSVAVSGGTSSYQSECLPSPVSCPHYQSSDSLDLSLNHGAESQAYDRVHVL